MYAVGQTGTGKTTLLTSLITQDIALGRGCALLDPHGDVAEALLDRIPRSRTDDTIYFNPTDPEHVPSLNLLEPAPLDKRPLIAAGIVATMRHVWRDNWGPRSEYIAYNGLAALLDHSARRSGISLLGLPRMFTDKHFRARVILHTSDAKVRSFWTDEFAKWPERLQQEAVAPLQNKLGQLLSVPVIRNVIGQATSTFSFDEVMNGRRIFIANLAKGMLGESPSSLFGSLLMTGFELAALRRQPIPEEERDDFALFVDEFQNFATDSFASMLSESRKFRLNLYLTHQYLSQLSVVVRDAIFGNVGTLISFRVGASRSRPGRVRGETAAGTASTMLQQLKWAGIVIGLALAPVLTMHDSVKAQRAQVRYVQQGIPSWYGPRFNAGKRPAAKLRRGAPQAAARHQGDGDQIFATAKRSSSMIPNRLANMRQG